jgi:hypothetical protein
MLTSSWTVTWMWGLGWPPLPVVTPRSRCVFGSVLELGLPDPDHDHDHDFLSFKNNVNENEKKNIFNCHIEGH